MRPGQLNDLGERLGIFHCQVGEGLAVQLDVGVLQAGDKLTVTQAAHAASGVDAHDPQLTEFALADATVPESVDATADQRHDRLTIEVVPALPEALGQLPHAFAAAEDGLAATCSGHGYNILRVCGPAMLRLATHDFDVLLGNFADLDELGAELALALAGLVTVQVFLAGLGAFELARGGHAEAFLRGLMRLHLGHGGTILPTARDQMKKAPGPSQGAL